MWPTWTMPARARSAATILVLVLLLVLGARWGLSAATKPFPEREETSICTVQTVPAGTRVYPDQVTVSVLNASSREGLAGRTMQLLEDEGFAAGESDNAPSGTRIDYAEIWTDDPENPAVRLVASWLGPATEIIRRDSSAAGVVVLVGDDFKDLAKGRASMRVDADVRVCGPSAG